MCLCACLDLSNELLQTASPLPPQAAVLGAVPRVLSAAVSCNTWPNCSFRVDFNGTSSVEIPVTTSQDEMERAVNAIPGLTHYGVILLDADNSTDSALSINLTILLPPLQAVSVSMVTIDGSETVNEVREASAPERITLSLGEGRFSNSLDVVGVSSNDVQEALIELLSWQCDNPLQSVGDVYWSDDYEGEVVDVWSWSWIYGVVVSDTEPYCGRHSLLRPHYFYGSWFRTIPVRYQGFDVYTYRYVSVCVCVCVCVCAQDVHTHILSTNMKPYIHTPGYLDPQIHPCSICRYALLTKGESPTIGSIFVLRCKWTAELSTITGSSTSLRGGGRPETPSIPTGSTSALMCTRLLGRMTGLTLAATTGSYGCASNS